MRANAKKLCAEYVGARRQFRNEISKKKSTDKDAMTFEKRYEVF